MRYCMDVVLNRNSTQASWWKCAVVGCALACLTLAGCGKSANGEYRDFDETVKSAKDSKLPVITPGATDPALAGGTVETTTDADVNDNETAAAVTETPETLPIEKTAVTDETNSGEPDVIGTEPGNGDAVATEPKEIKLLVANKDFTKDKETKALRVSYDDIDLLRILNMEPVPADAVDHFPGWLKQLNGKEIRIRGFMYPAYSSTGLAGFLLARDNDICCFGREAKIYDLFKVMLVDGLTTDYIEGRPFDVVGTFHIDPLVEDDEVLQLYRIDEARVIAN